MSIEVSPIFTKELVEFFGKGTLEEFVDKARILGLINPGEMQQLSQMCADASTYGKKYFHYRNTPAMIFLCSSESEQNALKEVEERCGGTPFTTRVSELLEMCKQMKHAVILACSVEEVFHISNTMEFLLNSSGDIPIWGFHKSTFLRS